MEPVYKASELLEWLDGRIAALEARLEAKGRNVPEFEAVIAALSAMKEMIQEDMETFNG